MLMEWGEQMAGVLADVRLEIHIDRPIDKEKSNEFTSEGKRVVTLVPVGGDWCDRLKILD